MPQGLRRSTRIPASSQMAFHVWWRARERCTIRAHRFDLQIGVPKTACSETHELAKSYTHYPGGAYQARCLVEESSTGLSRDLRCQTCRNFAKSCRHIVRNSNQNPVTANQAMAEPTMMISGWLKLVRFA